MAGVRSLIFESHKLVYSDHVFGLARQKKKFDSADYFGQAMQANAAADGSKPEDSK